jgi:hypothetical protein
MAQKCGEPPMLCVDHHEVCGLRTSFAADATADLARDSREAD